MLSSEVKSLEKDRTTLLDVRRQVEAETEAVASVKSQLRLMETQLEAATEASRTARTEARNADTALARCSTEHTQLRMEIERRKRELDEVSAWLRACATRAAGPVHVHVHARVRRAAPPASRLR